jgi:hypothetical protein
MKQLLLVTYLSILALGSAAQVSFTATADTNKILIGEQLQVLLEASMPEGTGFTWPVADSLEGLEVIKTSALDTVLDQGVWKIRQTLTLSAFDSGYFAFPQQRLLLGNSPYFSEAVPVAAFLPEVDPEQEMYDIKGVMDVGLNWWLIGGILLAVLLLVVVGIFGYRYFARHKTPAYKAAKKALPPHEWALARLREIEQEKLWQNDKVKAYYSEVTDVLRQYMERALALNAMESTASEIRLKLKEISLDEELKERTNKALYTAEMVKFAKEKPGKETHLALMATALDFVQATAPKPEEAET